MDTGYPVKATVRVFGLSRIIQVKNLEKHKLDFIAVRLLFDGRKTVTAKSDNPHETRYITTAEIDGKF